MAEKQMISAQGRLILYAVLFVCVVVFTGCVTDASKQIGAFSEAAITMANNTTQAFDLVEKVHYNREVSLEVQKFDNKGFSMEPIPPYLSQTNLQVRLEVLEGLKTYAANLSSLMGNTALTNLDQATTQFGQALVSLDTNLVKDAYFKSAPVSGTDLRIFTAAINAIGHWVIEYEQNKDAKNAIAEMQPNVTNLCRLFHKDFEILEKQVDNDLFATVSNEKVNIDLNLTQFNANPGEKRAIIQEMAGLIQERRSDAELFAAIESAVDKMQKAHEALGQLFSDNKTNVNSLITEFSADAKRISKYYSSLKASK